MLALAFGISVVLSPSTSTLAQPNVLLITVDDMNYDSTGLSGCTVPNITPNMDTLAAQSMRFEYAHVNISVCQPCRSVLMTGRYPHRNGAIGFGTDYGEVNADVPTLEEQLHAAGYYLGILAKTTHLLPYTKFCWDETVGAGALGDGRDPVAYYNHTTSFIQHAQAAGKPFFLMANSEDPHREFETNIIYDPDEDVQIPCFLPDLPDIRTELAQYYTSTHRADQTVGKVLQALAESGEESNTLVMFISDNGMSFPYSKANVWLASTKTPWFVRWPGVVQSGTVDADHMISGIDFMPTILDAVGLPQVPGMDGQSFYPLLTGGSQEGRDRVYTVFHITAAENEYPMRCVQGKKYGYIYNAWSNGQTMFSNEAQSGLTWNAMWFAGLNDPDIMARFNFFMYRVPEELYDYEVDPCALNNLAAEPQYSELLWQYRLEMQAKMQSTTDPLTATYAAYLATLPQDIPPVITQQPSNQSVVAGGSATFTVVSAGSSPLSHQWQKNQTDLSNGGHYSGCTTPSLTVSSAEAEDAAAYRCVVTNSYGSATSNEAALTIIRPVIPGDFDHDDDVDQEDFGYLQHCLGMTALPSDPDCADANLDGDTSGHVNRDDVVVFLRCLSGPGVVGNTGCAD